MGQIFGRDLHSEPDTERKEDKEAPALTPSPTEPNPLYASDSSTNVNNDIAPRAPSQCENESLNAEWDADLDYKKLFQCAPVPLYLISTREHYPIVAMNDTSLKEINVNWEEVRGHTFFDAFQSPGLSEQAAAYRRSLEKTIETKSTVLLPDLCKYDIPSSVGGNSVEERYWSSMYTPILDEYGHVAHILLKSVDMTDTMVGADATCATWEVDDLMKRVIQANIELAHKSQSLRDAYERLDTINKQLELSMEAAKVSSKAKADFLANISHEMRTPLNAILGFSELLERDQTITGDHKQFVHYVYEAGNHLLELINDLLDLAKIDAGKLHLNPHVVNVRELMHKATSAYASKCREKGLELKVTVFPDTPQYVVADPQRLKQVIQNLLSNAVKFTEKGYIEVEVSQTPIAQDSVILNVTVSDCGVGIPESDLSHIFERFVQVEKKKITGGTGLGLTISKELARLMDGDIEVKSKVGVGSTFAVRVRVATATAPAVTSVEAPLSAVLPQYADATILIVDDVEANRKILKAALLLMGFKSIREASDGVEAIEVLKESPCDLVFMDIFMPRLGGIQATKRIRQEFSQSVKVFGVTASELSPSQTTELHDIFDSTISKPIKFTQLQRELEIHCGVKFVATAPSTKPRRLLLVDDQLSIRRLIAKTLEGTGFEIDQASNGYEAIEKVRKNAYDVVLMDRVMPGLDGFETAETIWREGLAKNAPIIIIMSADFEDWNREKKCCKEVYGVIEKPVKLQEFLRLVGDTRGARIDAPR